MRFLVEENDTFVTGEQLRLTQYSDVCERRQTGLFCAQAAWRAVAYCGSVVDRELRYL
ncbi:MAG: hypothetical protein QM784_20370 [Polyangiaceae bacterium]